MPMVINAVKPFVSDQDIRAGGDWNKTIVDQLNEAKFGIICVTRSNKDRPWLLFEAGALSRQVGNEATRVAPLLIDFDREVDVGLPLSRFQLTMPTQEGMLKLLQSIN